MLIQSLISSVRIDGLLVILGGRRKEQGKIRKNDDWRPLTFDFDGCGNDRKEGDLPTKQSKGLNEDKYILAQKHYVNQAEYVFDGDEVVVKNLVHYENLATEFDALMKTYGINTSLPSKDKGGTYTDKNKGRLSHTDLDPETIALINKFAKPDFEKFGYQMVDKFEKDDGYSLEAKIDKMGNVL